MGRQRVPSTDELLAIARSVIETSGKAGVHAALVGGLAMQLYGSSRLTKDIDIVSEGLPASFRKPPTRKITFGGAVYSGPKGIEIDWIVRGDDYEDLYLAALDAARKVSGVTTVPMEYLAAMKFAAMRPKDYEDLMFLLVHPNIDMKKAKGIVEEYVGGRFALDQFNLAIEEAEWRASQE